MVCLQPQRSFGDSRNTAPAHRIYGAAPRKIRAKFLFSQDFPPPGFEKI
jgi:hypothetical protein